MGRHPRKSAKPRQTLQIEPKDMEELRAIAHSLGYIVPSGVNFGMGSVSAMMTAIAQGKIKIKRK